MILRIYDIVMWCFAILLAVDGTCGLRHQILHIFSLVYVIKFDKDVLWFTSSLSIERSAVRILAHIDIHFLNLKTIPPKSHVCEVFERWVCSQTMYISTYGICVKYISFGFVTGRYLSIGQAMWLLPLFSIHVVTSLV